MKRIKRSSDFIDVPSTVDNFLAGLVKTIYSVETKKALYQAHTLDEALQLWSDARHHGDDTSEVDSINQLG